MDIRGNGVVTRGSGGGARRRLRVGDGRRNGADFAAMMIPHHQGAIDMATIELRFGKDQRLRRLAQGIMIEQQQEIEAMRRILSSKGALPERHAPAIRGEHHPGD